MEGDRRSPALALFLSVVPGVGHLYCGRVGSGIGWLFAVFVLYNTAPVVGLLMHIFCAASAARAAADENRRERDELDERRESAADVASLLDRAVPRPDPSASPPPPADADPPPRLMRAAFAVPAERLLQALADAMAAQGMLVLGVDRDHLRARGSADLGGGAFASVVAQVEPTPAGSRARLLVDRPRGSPDEPARDDAILRGLLERTERILGEAGGTGRGEALTEDHFLEQLREAWESYEQGWLPEAEWLERKRSLVASVTLRPGTRESDFLSACKPLVEHGVLAPDDLRAIERSLGR